MALDALEPGPDLSYPNFPRDSQGRPLWSDTELTDGQQVDGVTPMPRGIRYSRGTAGRRITHDVTPRDTAGLPINPPVRPTP